MAEYILETRGITKKYGGVTALSDVSLHLEKGLIHALVGENGAGKSTLIRILSGIEPPTSGAVVFEGNEVKTFDPHAAHEMGISTVYQEPMQMELMSVEENIYTGRYTRNRWGLVDYKALTKQVNELMDRVSIHLDPKQIVGTMSLANRQMVEIIKAVSFNSRLIIFDEPTASLTIEETETLKRIIRDLKKQGITVIYISHRLEEIFDLCDTVTILRDGTLVDQQPIEMMDTDKLISRMVGREMSELYPAPLEGVIQDAVILKAENLRNEKVKDVSFEVHRGEILGFSGLVGAGRTETANILFGIDKAEGTITLEDKTVTIRNPEDAINLGIGLVPEDRKTEGLIQILSVGDNTVLSCLNMIRKARVFVDHGKEKKIIDSYVDRLRIKTPSKNQLVRNLSGGNQQKVVFAKWMACQPKVLILDEPTRGVDVGAKAEIYDIIQDLARSGMGVIMISSEMNELIAMCDRICVMHEGHINAVLERSEFGEEIIMQYSIKEA